MRFFKPTWTKILLTLVLVFCFVSVIEETDSGTGDVPNLGSQQPILFFIIWYLRNVAIPNYFKLGYGFIQPPKFSFNYFSLFLGLLSSYFIACFVIQALSKGRTLFKPTRWKFIFWLVLLIPSYFFVELLYFLFAGIVNACAPPQGPPTGAVCPPGASFCQHPAYCGIITSGRNLLPIPYFLPPLAHTTLEITILVVFTLPVSYFLSCIIVLLGKKLKKR